MADTTNSTPAQVYEDALLALADAKNEAMAAKAIHERAIDAAFLIEEGAVDVRKTKARQSEKVIKRQIEHISAAQAENVARAVADGKAARFEEWRTLSSNRRAEMNLR